MRHGAEHAQGEGVGLPCAQDEAERDLTKTIEDAMADGEIDEDEQKAILKKKVSLRNFSLPLSPCLPPSCTVTIVLALACSLLAPWPLVLIAK